MAEINAFVSYGFEEGDKVSVQPFLDHLDTFARAHPSFKWTHAREPEAKDLGKKVLDRIEGRNVLIAICTRKERVAKPVDVKGVPFPFVTQARIQSDKLHWKTSDWIIQEIGIALGRGIDIIILLEEGVREPGALQGNIERIPFSSCEPSRAFDTLDRMLLSFDSKPPAVPATASNPPKKESIEEEVWGIPKPEWSLEDYEISGWIAVLRDEGTEKKLNSIKEILQASPLGTADNLATWNGSVELAKIECAKEGDFEALKALSEKHPQNQKLLRSLSRAYEYYQDYASAAKVSEEEATISSLETERLNAFIRAAKQHRKNKDNFSASKNIEKMRSLINNIDDEVHFLQGITELFDETDIEKICAQERILKLKPADIETRFSLGLAYQRRSTPENMLSLYHYLRIPENQLSPIAWNNLGVAYGRNDISGLEVEAYKKAESKSETLAMSNLANKLIDAGFLEEARVRCERARSMPHYDKHIDQSFVRLAEVSSAEEQQAKNVDSKAEPQSRFFASAGEALSKADTSIIGQWQHDKCLIVFTYDANKLLGVGKYQLKREQSFGFLAFLGGGQDSKTEIDYRINYEVTQMGHFFKGTYNEFRDDDRAYPPLFSDNNSSKIIMVLSEDALTLEICEEKHGNHHFYKLHRIQKLSSYSD